MTSWLEQRSRVLGLSSQTSYALQLCMEEAVTNVISYAFKAGSEHEVRIKLWREGEVLMAEITDDGSPFDPLTYEAAPMGEHLGGAKIGGLGIKLIRSFARHLAYRRSGATNHLLMSFPGR